MTGPLGADGTADLVGEEVVELVVAGAAAQDRPEVELLQGEQAGAQLPLRGHADAVALLAERLGDAGDDADVADAVGVAEPLGRLDMLGVAGTGDRQMFEREHGVDAFEDLASRHDLFGNPAAVGVERHELNEAHTDAALDSGLAPVKLNAVVMRGVNDDEVVDLAAYGREKGVGVRFIEFMPLDAQGEWSADKVVPAQEILDRIDAAFPLVTTAEADADGAEPAALHRYADGRGEVGVIASVTEPFCENCDRVRLTAEGQFRTCLFALDETDLRAVLRDEAAADVDERLAAAIEQAVGTKWAGHRIGQVDFVRPQRSMSQIGG